MSRPLPVRVLLALFGALLIVFATPAWSEEDERSSADRWIPGVGIRSEGIVNPRQGSVESLERGRVEGDSQTLFWAMGLDLHLQSPELEMVPFAPRFFVRGGAHLGFDNEDPLANEGNPGVPAVVAVGQGGTLAADAVENLGSATRVETRPLLWSAGAGLAFDVEVMDLRFRVKPSVEWMWQKDRLRAVMSDAETDSTGTPPLCDPCRLISIDKTTSEAYHSIGPGLELEFVAGRIHEKVVMTVFTGFQAMAIIGSRESTFRATGAWSNSDGSPVDRPDSTVTSEYERDRWNYRFGVGVRFHWEPE